MRISKKNKKIKNRHKTKSYRKKISGGDWYNPYTWGTSAVPPPSENPVIPEDTVKTALIDHSKILSEILKDTPDIYKSYLLIKNPTRNGIVDKAKKWLAYRNFFFSLHKALKQLGEDEKKKDALCVLFDCEKFLKAEKINQVPFPESSDVAASPDIPIPVSPGGRPKTNAKLPAAPLANPAINVNATTEPNKLNNKFPGLTKIIENGFTSLKKNQKNIKNKLTEISGKFPKFKPLPGKGIHTTVPKPKITVLPEPTKEGNIEMAQL